jgi:hypothetical protein
MELCHSCFLSVINDENIVDVSKLSNYLIFY